jgi:hypothetical protein
MDGEIIMNKMLKSENLFQGVGTFGFLGALLFKLFGYDVLAIIFVVITAVLMFLLLVFQYISVEKYKKMYINNNESVNNLNNDIHKDMVNKIIFYKRDIKIHEICYLIFYPFILIDVVLIYYIFGAQLFADGETEILWYMILILFFIISLKSIINSVKQIKKLNTIDFDLENRNFEVIKEKPVKIKPLYHGKVSRRNSLKVGYGLEIHFENNLILIALIDFPFIGNKQIEKIIEEELMNKKYTLKYLSNSKVIVEIDSKIIEVFK